MNASVSFRLGGSCRVPTVTASSNFIRTTRVFFLPCRTRMVLCEQMDNELTTTTDQNSTDPRIACFDSRSNSKLTSQHSVSAQSGAPQRVGDSNHQGAPSGSAPIGRVCPTTVAAPQQGGASHSKWTRRTRPWNASTPATVVASLIAGPRSALDVYSGGEVPDTTARQSQGEPCTHAVRKGSRIHGSPVRPRIGRGSLERTSNSAEQAIACGQFLF